MLSLKFALRYFLHRFRAINRHGLHSPFVYRLVDEVIYDFPEKKVYTSIQNLIKPDKTLSPVDKLLYRLVADAAPKTILVMEPLSQTDDLIIRAAAPDAHIYSAQQAVSNQVDAIIIDAAEHANDLLPCFVQSTAYVHEQSFVIIKNAHRHTATQHAWQEIKKHPQVTVTVDLFWLSLIYFRKGQVREDFLIKY